MKVYNLENIKSATELKHRTEVISMNERSIIVLDTFTGIAQKLQAVSISLFHLDIEKVMNQLQDFENDCGNWLDNLLSSEMQKAEAAKEIKVHIDQISRLCNENPNIIDDHEIMAHGAMISSLILSHYLEECTKKNFILNSCHFMRLGLDRKPDIKYVKKNVEELMKDCPDVPILITQSRLCKNAYDEVDFFPQIGNEYYATVIGAVFHADEIITSLRSDEICFRGMEHTRTLTYGEAENFIDSGIALLHPECIPLARTAGMAIVLIKTPEDTLRISSEKTGTKVKAAVSRRGVVFVKLRSLGVLTSYLFIDTQDTVYMDEVLAVGAEKDIGVELGFQLVERIRHGLGRAVVQAKERIAFVQSDVADIFHLHGNIAVAVRQKKTLAITVIALPHIFQ